MAMLPEGDEFNGIYCYRQGEDPATFFYIPGPPVPARTSMGDPSISLITMVPVSMLQVGLQWNADSETLTNVAGQLAKKYPELDPAHIQLVPAPVSVTGVTLELSNRDGRYESIGVAASSSMPPFSAIFSISLKPDQSTLVISALNGGRDIMRAVYSLSVDVGVNASATLSGDMTDDLRQLGSNATEEQCENSLKAALDANRLTLETTKHQLAPESLLAQVRQEALDKAANLLYHFAAGSEPDFDAAHLKVAVSKTASLPVAITRTSDAATWLSGNAGRQHIQRIEA